MLMEVVAAHHDPERVDLPQGVLGCSRAAWAFVAGASCALGAVALPVWAACAKVAWRRWHAPAVAA
jgi:hypothetical protein